jgi:hypothetical protein
VFRHFAHLLERAFACSYSFLGTSPGGLAVQIVTIFTTTIKGGWWRPSAWKTNWQGGLKRAVYTLLIVWAITFAVCSATSVYHDHRDLTERLRAVVNEKDQLKNGLAVRDNYIQKLETSRSQTPGSRTSPPTPAVNAPGSIPIINNKGTVDHPTVNNNYAPPIRRLTEAQRKGITDFLSTIPPSIQISIGSVVNSSDAENYALQLFPLFSGRHLGQTAPALRTGFTMEYTGVFVATPTDEDPASPYRDAFVRELVRLGIDAKQRNGSKVPTGDMEIVVGFRPEEVR